MIDSVELQVIESKHIYITWNAVAGAAYFEIERQIANSNDWKILENGLWVAAGTADQLTNTDYLDRDVGQDNYQYRVRYYDGAAYSAYACSGIVGLSVQARIGYTFGNYVVPSGQWGVIGTPDDMRYTYLYGIAMTATNGQEWQDSQFASLILSALEDFESYLGITIRRRRYMTQPSSKVRQKFWNTNVDYTDEEDPYPFDPDVWRDGFGSLKLRHNPIVSISRAELYVETDAKLLDLMGWLRLDKNSGLLSFYPKRGIETVGPFAAGTGLYFRTVYQKGYPHAFKFDYDAGYETSEFVPEGLRETILKWAAVKSLNAIGDGLLAGFSSSSISLDGLSESFSSTQSATSAYFGARIKTYVDEIKEWLKHNRYKFSNMPIGFV